MIVILAGSTDVIDSFHALFSQKSLPKVLLLLMYLEGVNKSVLEKARSLEAISRLRHEDASNVDHVTR